MTTIKDKDSVGEALPERDSTKTNSEQGVYRKFEVRRTDGSDAPGGKHDGCEYFVLDVVHDKHAKAALAAYAEACATTHPVLSRDMIERYGLEARAQQPQPADVVNAARAMLAERDRMVESGRYNDLAGVAHRLRKTLSALPSQPADGVIVPKEITLKMQKAYFEVIDANLDRVESDATFGRFASQREAYRAMLAAAPALPSQPDTRDEVIKALRSAICEMKTEWHDPKLMRKLEATLRKAEAAHG